MFEIILIFTLIQLSITYPEKVIKTLYVTIIYFLGLPLISRTFPIAKDLSEYLEKIYRTTFLLPKVESKNIQEPFASNSSRAVLEKIFENSTLVHSAIPSPLEKFEEQHSTKIILINHPINETPLYGILSQQKSLTLEDAQVITTKINSLHPEQHITLILNTPGGSVTATEVIVNALLNHKGKITTYIPYQCCSAGMLIALVSDEIYMMNTSYCGPVDPVYGIFNVNRIVNFCNEHKSNSNVLISILFNFLQTSLNPMLKRVENLINKIVEKRGNIYTEKLDKFKETLLYGGKNHDQPIFYEELKDLLPQIKLGINQQIFDFLK